ncbi:MAG: hypothetical protein AAB853_04025 [Patescibacteria group bacterium]
MSYLSDSSVGSFRELWRKHYGVELTEEQARDYAERFLGLVKLIVEPELHLEKRKPP